MEQQRFSHVSPIPSQPVTHDPSFSSDNFIMFMKIQRRLLIVSWRSHMALPCFLVTEVEKIALGIVFSSQS